MRRPFVAVVGTGRGVPAKVLANTDFAAMGIDTTHEWIMERTGIAERRLCSDGETTASMAVEAAKTAMERAGVHAGEIDALILSTATPDRCLLYTSDAADE